MGLVINPIVCGISIGVGFRLERTTLNPKLVDCAVGFRLAALGTGLRVEGASGILLEG